MREEVDRIKQLDMEDVVALYEDCARIYPEKNSSSDSPEQRRTPRYLMIEDGCIRSKAEPIRTSFYSIGLSESGYSKEIINGESIKLRPGHLQFITPDHVRSIVETSDDQALREICFQRSFLEEGMSADNLDRLLWIDPRFAPVFEMNQEEIARIRQLFDKIQNEINREERFHEQIIRNAILELLYQINRIDKSCLRDGQNPSSQSHRLYQHFKELVKKHMQQKKLVKDYARLLHVTPKHLSEVVKAESGRPALEYIHQELIREAGNRLAHTDQPVKQVAYGLGFETPSHFSRFFKEKSGESPSTYRENRKIEH